MGAYMRHLILVAALVFAPFASAAPALTLTMDGFTTDVSISVVSSLLMSLSKIGFVSMIKKLFRGMLGRQ